MTARKKTGTSFIEVLVASVLLAVGVVGCLSTLAAAARLRNGASVREDLAARAHDRLGWFVVRGCLVADTTFTSPDSAKVRDHWEQQRDSARSRLTLELSSPSAAMVHRVALTAELPCP